MPTFGFWNLHGNSDAKLISHFIHQNSIEILLLAEREFSPGELILNYAAVAKQPLYHIQSRAGVARVDFFATFPPERFESVWEDNYSSCIEYNPEVGLNLTLIGLHLSSKLHLNEKEQLIEAQHLRSEIERIETERRHTRTIIFGDFNMDPFEAGMVANHAFHAVMDRRIAAKRKRTVLFKDSSFFYNPMWKPMGDWSANALGTFYRTSGSHIHYFWNTFDQVLLRPSLLTNFKEEDLRIVQQIGSTPLLLEEPPGINSSLSDHLPIIFQIHT
jgi:hypothetical protein